MNIQIKNLQKWYGDHHVLIDINETIEHGQTVVVCGPSGSGKSTLIRCINALEPYQEGEIIVEGVSLNDKKLNVSKLRTDIDLRKSLRFLKNFRVILACSDFSSLVRNFSCLRASILWWV